MGPERGRDRRPARGMPPPAGIIDTELRLKIYRGNVGAHLCVRPQGGHLVLRPRYILQKYSHFFGRFS